MVIIKDGIVLVEGTKEECLDLVGFEVDNYGQITLGGYKDSISYCLKDWTYTEIKKDFLKGRFLELLSGSDYRLYVELNLKT
jgi:hypothetical protein